jgi:hypothetical protein
MSQMEINGLYCGFNMPLALKESANAQGLPPYAVQRTYKVDEYNCPDNWMNGSPKVGSHFVAVKPGHGMWLDFTLNQSHTHHVAVLVSVQGVNPITGQKQMGFKLEQYRDKCPIHGCNFGADRYCPQCKYKWPPQNYLATTGGGALWIDGFRNAAGEVRQYVFTEESAKGVAAQIIGNDRVFAIGVAFYLSKQPKPQPRYATRGGFESCGLESFGATKGGGNLESLGGVLRSRGMSSSAAPRPKQIEVAAGAKINQDINLDPENVESFWQEEAAGFLYINYCDEETCRHILSEGKRDLTMGGEGFLAGVEKYHQ